MYSIFNSDNMLEFSKILACLFSLVYTIQVVLATIDLTLPELEHLANHLTTDECHKLVAALHFDSFKINQAVENAENAGRWCSAPVKF